MSWKHSLWRTIARGRERMGLAEPRGLRILGYHSVGRPLSGDPYGLAVMGNRFQRQMEIIVGGKFGRRTTLSGARLDGRPEVAVTFDDGYEDTLKTAAPILQKLQIPFSVCVTPGLIDSGRPHMTWDEVIQLSKVPGCEIGAHGLTHARLDALSDAELKEELTASRARLEDAIDRPVVVMTWPHGAASRRAAFAAKAAGYTRAACSLYGYNEPEREARLLRRVEITGFDDEQDFIGKLSGAWDWFALRQGDPTRR